MTSQNVWHAEFGMAWGVKESFVSYIQQSRDGQIAVNGGAGVTTDGQFYFPLKAVQEEPEQIVLEFGGRIDFRAHFGFLSIALQAPRILVRGDNASLEIRDHTDSWLQLAKIHLTTENTDSSASVLRSEYAALAKAGVEFFGDTYTVGEPLAPLTLRIPARHVAASSV